MHVWSKALVPVLQGFHLIPCQPFLAFFLLDAVSCLHQLEGILCENGLSWGFSCKLRDRSTYWCAAWYQRYSKTWSTTKSPSPIGTHPSCRTTSRAPLPLSLAGTTKNLRQRGAHDKHLFTGVNVYMPNSCIIGSSRTNLVNMRPQAKQTQRHRCTTQ